MLERSTDQFTFKIALTSVTDSLLAYKDQQGKFLRVLTNHREESSALCLTAVTSVCPRSRLLSTAMKVYTRIHSGKQFIECNLGKNEKERETEDKGKLSVA